MAAGLGVTLPAPRDSAELPYSNGSLGSVAFSWILANGSVYSGAVNQRYPIGPDQLLYVAANQTLWTAFGTPPLGGVDNVTLWNLSSGATSILSGVGNVTGWVLDPALDTVFLTEVPRGQSQGELAAFSTRHPDLVRAPTSLGPNPDGVALDPTTGDLWVTGPNSTSTAGNITIVSATTGAVRSVVPVGVGPTVVAFAPALGLAYVGYAGSANISVLNSTTGAPVGGGVAFSSPLTLGGLTFDPQSNELLALVDDPPGSISHLLVLDPGSLAIVATDLVPGPGNATSLAVDPGTGDAFVTTTTTAGSPGELLRWAPSSNSWSAVASLGGQSTVQCFDPASKTDFIGRSDQIYASAVNISTTTTTARTISFGAGPRGGVYDSVDGRVYVVNSYGGGRFAGSGPDVLEAVDPVHGTPAVEVSPAPPGTSSVGSDLVGVVFDPLSGRIFVADHGWSSASVLSAAGGTFVANLSLPFAPTSVADDARRGLVYFASVGGGVVAYHTGNLTQAVRWNLTAPRVPWPGFIQSLAVDSGTGNVVDLVPDVNGTFDYGTIWILTPTNGSSRPVPGVGGMVGGVSVAYDPLDGDAYIGIPNGYLLVLNLTNLTFVGSANLGGGTLSPVFDAGHSAVEVAEATANQVAVFNGSDPASVSPTPRTVPTGPGPDGLVAVPGSDQLIVANYLSGTLDLYSPRPLVGALTVHLAIPTVGEAIPPLPVDDVSTPVYFDALAGGGLPPLTLTYSGLPGGCASASVGHLLCYPSSAGPSSVTVNVTDAAGLSATGTATLVVVPMPTLSASATPPAVDAVNPVVVINGSVVGGVEPFHYVVYFGDVAWPLAQGSVSGTTFSVGQSYNLTGQFTATVLVVDALGLRRTVSLTVTVGTPMGGSLEVVSPSSATAPLGEGVRLLAMVHGGVGPFTFTWTFPDGSPPVINRTSLNSSELSHEFLALGKEVVEVWVNDSAHGNLSLLASVTVLATPSPPGLPASGILLSAAVAAALLLAGAAYFVWRRRPAPPGRPPR